MRTSGGTMVACNDYDGDEGGIWGAYSSQVMNDHLLGFMFTNSFRLLASFACLLRNCDVGPSNLFRIGQARGNRRCRRWILAIIEIKFLDPVPESEELGCFDELGDSRKHLGGSERNSRATHLWHRVRCHEPEYMGLDPLVQLDQRLELGCVEGTSLLQLNTSLERLASETGHHLV